MAIAAGRLRQCYTSPGTTGSGGWVSGGYDTTGGGSDGFVADGFVAVISTLPNTVATPVFSPAAPYSFAASVDVTIACATAGATIRYTADGTEPTASSTLYTEPLPVTATTMLKARAFKDGMADSSVVSGVYTLDTGYSIQAHIDAANNGDVIIVPPGTYYEIIDFKGKAITLSSADPQDPAVVAATVIDGGRTGKQVVTFATGEGPQSVLTGFTITHGGGPGDAGDDPTVPFGGGICCRNSSPSIIGNVIRYNESQCGYGTGGGIQSYGGSPVITGNTITDNRAYGSGGGVFCSGGSASITGNSIERNYSAGDGGGIYSNSATVIRDNVVSGNEAAGYGGGICGGAGLIEDNEINYNTASGGGGIADGDPDGLVGGPGLITGNTISGNLGVNGSGGIGSNCDIIGNVISHNGTYWGGGGGIGGGSGRIEGNRITNNWVDDAPGGGIYAGSGDIVGNVICNNRSYSPAGIACQGVSPNIVNNTICGNYATMDTGVGGIRVWGVAAPTIKNCIIWDNHSIDPSYGDYWLEAAAQR